MNILNWLRPARAAPLVFAIPHVSLPAGRGQFDRDVMPAIRPDLIPPSSWGSSLANLLTRTSWSEVRQPVVYRKPCQICGAAQDQERQLDCHEIWSYAEPPRGAGEGCVGVQRLIGLVALCRLCHEFFHMGLARMRGREAIVSERMMTINRWSPADYQTWVREAAERAVARNERGWILDVSLIRHRGPLVIDQARDWTRRPDGILYRPRHYHSGAPNPERPETYTAIFGCDYEIVGVHYEAVDPSEAYDGLMPEAGDFAFAKSMVTHA
jgi:hypothetical protein